MYVTGEKKTHPDLNKSKGGESETDWRKVKYDSRKAISHDTLRPGWERWE